MAGGSAAHGERRRRGRGRERGEGAAVDLVRGRHDRALALLAEDVAQVHHRHRARRDRRAQHRARANRRQLVRVACAPRAQGPVEGV